MLDSPSNSPEQSQSGSELHGWILPPPYSMDVPRLILVNGLPGSGKSVLGRRYLEDHQLALALDIDTIRSMLGRSLEEPKSRGLRREGPGLPMAQTHLQAGHDVLVSNSSGDPVRGGPGSAGGRCWGSIR